MAADDGLTETRVEVAVHVAASPATMWRQVTDIGRFGEWSPECSGGAWFPDSTEPTVGARFAGYNRFRNGFASEVACVVTEVIPGRTFAWIVLDPREDIATPGSKWRFDLTTDGDGCQVRQRFEHGPGDTGLRRAMLGDPHHAQESLTSRLAQLRADMRATIEAMSADLTPNADALR